MRFAVFALAALLIPLADGAWGQMVRTYPGGGVNVRAPFVRVNVGPNGQTWVRAPFVNFTTPGRPPCYRAPPDQLQPLAPLPAPAPETNAEKSPPTPANPALLDWQTLRRMLHSGTTMLSDQLDELETGAGWKDYLQTALLARLLTDDVNEPPDSAALEALRTVLERYDATSRAAEFQSIAELRAFRTVHGALKELTTRPIAPPPPRPTEVRPAPSFGPREF